MEGLDGVGLGVCAGTEGERAGVCDPGGRVLCSGGVMSGVASSCRSGVVEGAGECGLAEGGAVGAGVSGDGVGV